MQKHQKKVKIYIFKTCGAISEDFEHFQKFKSRISPCFAQACALRPIFSKTRNSGLSFDIGLIPGPLWTHKQKLN